MLMSLVGKIQLYLNDMLVLGSSNVDACCLYLIELHALHLEIGSNDVLFSNSDIESVAASCEDSTLLFSGEVTVAENAYRVDTGSSVEEDTTVCISSELLLTGSSEVDINTDTAGILAVSSSYDHLAVTDECTLDDLYLLLDS